MMNHISSQTVAYDKKVDYDNGGDNSVAGSEASRKKLPKAKLAFKKRVPVMSVVILLIYDHCPAL